MLDIVPFLACFASSLPPAMFRQLACVVLAMLVIPGRITILGLSRWAPAGGSHRSLQRFFHSTLDWSHLHWLFVRAWLLRDDEFFLAADEVVVTKAGKKTFGLDRFFSSIAKRPVSGLCFLAFSLISFRHGYSCPIRMEPLLREHSEGSSKKKDKATSSPKKRARKQANHPADTHTQTTATPKSSRKKGRPKGSKKRDKHHVVLSPFLLFVQNLIRDILQVVGTTLRITYFVFDGELGFNAAAQMVRQTGLHLISKLRYNSALFLLYDGPQKSRGNKRIFGEKLNYQRLPDHILKETTTEEGIETRIYQTTAVHHEFADPLNVVIIVKINLTDGSRAHVILFSTDLVLSYDRLIRFYRLRFQLEFNFRDAKQYWGLEDFMAITQVSVYNSANLAMFMVNLSRVLIRHLRPTCPEFGVNDLRAWCRGTHYVLELLKLLPKMPQADVIDRLFSRMGALGSLHAAPP
jgi:hypothetical protein